LEFFAGYFSKNSKNKIYRKIRFFFRKKPGLQSTCFVEPFAKHPLALQSTRCKAPAAKHPLQSTRCKALTAKHLLAVLKLGVKELAVDSITVEAPEAKHFVTF
jgi:hypothetical protein